MTFQIWTSTLFHLCRCYYIWQAVWVHMWSATLWSLTEYTKRDQGMTSQSYLQKLLYLCMWITGLKTNGKKVLSNKKNFRVEDLQLLWPFFSFINTRTGPINTNVTWWKEHSAAFGYTHVFPSILFSRSWTSNIITWFVIFHLLFKPYLERIKESYTVKDKWGWTGNIAQ
jgi:hypothetical protein